VEFKANLLLNKFSPNKKAPIQRKEAFEVRFADKNYSSTGYS
jgi:hypothetical protein